MSESHFYQRHSRRFNKFARALKLETRDFAHLCADGRVIIDANEFSPARQYRSVQDAIDHFAHLIGMQF